MAGCEGLPSAQDQLTERLTRSPPCRQQEDHPLLGTLACTDPPPSPSPTPSYAPHMHGLTVACSHSDSDSQLLSPPTPETYLDEGVHCKTYFVVSIIFFKFIISFKRICTFLCHTVPCHEGVPYLSNETHLL